MTKIVVENLIESKSTLITNSSQSNIGVKTLSRMTPYFVQGGNKENIEHQINLFIKSKVIVKKSNQNNTLDKILNSFYRNTVSFINIKSLHKRRGNLINNKIILMSREKSLRQSSLTFKKGIGKISKKKFIPSFERGLVTLYKNNFQTTLNSTSIKSKALVEEVKEHHKLAYDTIPYK